MRFFLLDQYVGSIHGEKQIWLPSRLVIKEARFASKGRVHLEKREDIVVAYAAVLKISLSIS